MGRSGLDDLHRALDVAVGRRQAADGDYIPPRSAAGIRQLVHADAPRICIEYGDLMAVAYGDCGEQRDSIRNVTRNVLLAHDGVDKEHLAHAKALIGSPLAKTRIFWCVLPSLREPS